MFFHGSIDLKAWFKNSDPGCFQHASSRPASQATCGTLDGVTWMDAVVVLVHEDCYVSLPRKESSRTDRLVD